MLKKTISASDIHFATSVEKNRFCSRLGICNLCSFPSSTLVTFMPSRATLNNLIQTRLMDGKVLGVPFSNPRSIFIDDGDADARVLEGNYGSSWPTCTLSRIRSRINKIQLKADDTYA